jgi:hypothetical protein
MKALIILFIIICPAFYLAQIKKDTLSKGDRAGSNKADVEKQDLSTLKLNKFFIEHHVTYNPADAEYKSELQKSTLKEVISKSVNNQKDFAEENAKYILSDVRRSMQDKRSDLQKVVQEALGIAQTALVAGLAVREIVKETSRKKN